MEGIQLPKDLREMREKQFELAFNILKERTDNWKSISPELLTENSRLHISN